MLNFLKKNQRFDSPFLFLSCQDFLSSFKVKNHRVRIIISLTIERKGNSPATIEDNSFHPRSRNTTEELVNKGIGVFAGRLIDRTVKKKRWFYSGNGLIVLNKTRIVVRCPTIYRRFDNKAFYNLDRKWNNVAWMNALKERAQLLSYFLAGRSSFRGWPVFFSFFISLLYEIEQFLIFIISRTEQSPIKAFGNGPVFIKQNTVWIEACGSRGFNPFHLSLIARQRDTTDSLNIFEQSKTRLIPCVKCGTFIGPVVLTRRRSSIVRVFYRNSFFFFFPPTISPDPLIYKLLLCKIYLSIVKLFGNVEYL